MDSITLKGRDVYSKISILEEVRQDKNSKDYHIGRHAGKGFTVTPDFFAAWKGAKVAELTLTEQAYQRIDPANPEQPVTVNAWAYDGHMTYDQAKLIVVNEADLQVAEKQALKKIELTDAAVNALVEA